MTLRVRRLKNGNYVAEHRVFWLFWSSCYLKAYWDNIIPYEYITEEQAESDCKKYCEAEAKKKAEEKKAGVVKVMRCEDLL